MKWWWNQPNVPEDQGIRRRNQATTGKAASARNWFGYAAVQALALVANEAKSLDSIVLARALQGRTLPPDIALEADHGFFRAHDHQLMSTIFVKVKCTLHDSDPERCV